MENKETKTDIKEDKTTEIDWEEFDEQRRHLVIFGRDVSEIPCFRNSFLYGIGTGLGIGLGIFNLQLSFHCYLPVSFQFKERLCIHHVQNYLCM